MRLDKERFLNDFECILRSRYGTDVATASVKERYNAASGAVMSALGEVWHGRARLGEGKRAGYLSAEFLIGRAVFANLTNAGVLDEVRAALGEKGVELADFEEVEDAALGNGGLGRLAACYLESAATHNLPLDGYGLRYRYGLFKQSFEDGFQKETGDDWLKWGDPWSVRREDERVIVEFADQSVCAVPYDSPVIGYESGTVNTLRLWQSEPVRPFDFGAFDRMEGEKTAVEDYEAMRITDVLYPNDSTEAGRKLRLRQEYFLASASVQDILRAYLRTGKPIDELPEAIVLQLNDTHPVIAIPELIRLLEKQGVPFERAAELCGRVFRFTNHTVMAEALERWQGETVRELLPEIWKIIKKLHAKLLSERGTARGLYIVKRDEVYMANLAVYVSRKVNGVAELHTGILKNHTFAAWYKKYPEKFVNVTNGITPRRWLLLNNPRLAAEITARIGKGWQTELSELKKLLPYRDEPAFRTAFSEIKAENKRRLAAYIERKEGVKIDPSFIFDIQIKRLHEYKRQLLNAFSIAYIYQELKAGRLKDFKPTAFVFGAKSAPAYYNAKAIIKYINELARTINADEAVADRLKVVFVQNYNVSYAEKLVCAADVSEQISTAGMEASGTGNMKFMLNGTVTLGTLDGANVEICEEAGRENNYVFGATVEEVERVKKNYEPKKLLEADPALRRTVETLVDGTLSDGGTGMFRALYQSLTTGYEPDRYLVLYDFKDYVETKLRLNADYGGEAFLTKCIVNVACAGKFSADRAVKEYAADIWEIR